MDTMLYQGDFYHQANETRIEEEGGIDKPTHGDCFQFMAGLPAQMVDCVITDPPYFINGMGDDWQDKQLKEKSGLNKQRGGVVGKMPVGMKFDKNQGVQLQEFMLKVGLEWFRLLKPGGFVLCFSQNRLSHQMAMGLERAGFDIRDMYAWGKNAQAKAFTQDHFVKKNKNYSETEKLDIINQLQGRKTAQLKPVLEFIIMAQKPAEGTLVENWLKYKTGLIDVHKGLLDGQNFPATLMNCPHDKEKFDHLTQKPLLLLRHLVRIFTIENAIILDCFAGTGTTAVAAKIENRHFLTCDREYKYVQITNRRLAEIK